MAPFTFGVVLFVVWILFAAATSVFLFRGYFRTGISGFLWLFGALVVWPAIARVLTIGVSMGMAGFAASRGLTAASTMHMLVSINIVETVIGGILLLAAVIVLSNQVAVRLPQSSPAPPAPFPPAG